MNQVLSDAPTIFRALSDPGRLRCWQLLREEELSVGELAEILGTSQSTTSGMLKGLREASLVLARPDGRKTWYCAAPVASWVMDALAGSPLSDGDRQALRRVCGARPQEEESYQPGRSWEALARSALRVAEIGTVADVGVGAGELTMLLADAATTCYAVDRSAAALESLMARAQNRGLETLKRVEQDAENLQLPEAVDLLVFSQTLHHVGDPLHALHAAWDNLRAGGRIWVMELEPHTLELGHRWPGFSSEDLLSLLLTAGFMSVRVEPVGRDRRQLMILFATGVRP